MTYDELQKLKVSNKEKIIELLTFTERVGIEKVIAYLEKSSYFEDPASSKYHNAFEGGLADHSLKVYELALEKRDRFNIKIPEASIIITALLHDICKIGSYKKQELWRKDKFNKWERYPGYSYNDDVFPFGHGEKSVAILQNFIKLTKDEMLAIRWHMGSQEDRTGYEALRSPFTLILHTADYEASQILEDYGVQEHLIKL